MKIKDVQTRINSDSLDEAKLARHSGWNKPDSEGTTLKQHFDSGKVPYWTKLEVPQTLAEAARMLGSEEKAITAVLDSMILTEHGIARTSYCAKYGNAKTAATSGKKAVKASFGLE